MGFDGHIMLVMFASEIFYCACRVTLRFPTSIWDCWNLVLAQNKHGDRAGVMERLHIRCLCACVSTLQFLEDVWVVAQGLWTDAWDASVPGSFEVWLPHLTANDLRGSFLLVEACIGVSDATLGVPMWAQPQLHIEDRGVIPAGNLFRFVSARSFRSCVHACGLHVTWTQDERHSVATFYFPFCLGEFSLFPCERPCPLGFCRRAVAQSSQTRRKSSEAKTQWRNSCETTWRQAKPDQIRRNHLTPSETTRY